MTEELVTLYHGTTNEAGKNILNDGKIVGSNISQVRVANTESGYVFFSDKLGTALHYGSFKQGGNELEIPVPFYVFKLKIGKNMLIEDTNEIKHMKNLGCDFKDKVYKFKGDIDLIQHNCEYARITSVGIKDTMYERVNTLTKINTAYFHGEFSTI